VSNTSEVDDSRFSGKRIFRVLVNLQRIILTFWIGGLWTVGYIVVPVLFQQLPSHQMAGNVAGQLFIFLSWLGLIFALLLAVTYFFIDQAKWRYAVLLLITVFISINLFFLTPEIAALREMAGSALREGTELHSRFALLHGIASGLYLLVSLLGLLLVIRQPEEVC
jgi:hypothetical protein